MRLQKSFSKKLLRWHRNHPRYMPWKETKDPYRIWLSEIILQQTRVEQGTPYYEKMIRRFPTVKHLADADENEVMKAWEGLGYYSRARNLHTAAKQIMQEHKGKFPSSYAAILKLKGVGVYTAAAISSFAFDLPHAVVDGNVYRVLSRAFGIREATDTAKGKKFFSGLADQLLDRKEPSAYNQALMNFGAVMCTPMIPRCNHCIFRKECVAFTGNLVSKLPLKIKKNEIRTRWFNFLVLEDGVNLIIEKRNAKDIWRGLFQVPLIETEQFTNGAELINTIDKRKKLKIIDVSPVIPHQLSHQTIMAQFILVSASYRELDMQPDWRVVKKSELKNFGFPKLIVNYFEKFIH